MPADTGADPFAALATLNQAVLDAIPGAVYLCAADGRVVRFNRKAAELWGCAPKPEDPTVRFCGSFRLYRTDGTLLPHDQCPMATALRTGESFQDQEVVVEQPDGRRLTVRVNIAALRDEAGRVSGAINCFQDISDRKQAEERQRQLLEELNHRVKNTLATVRSMAASTARSVTSVGEFTSRFEARLLAFSQTHALLGEGQWSGASLRDLLGQQAAPYADPENKRIRLEGPTVELPPRLALDLSLILHELMTNAAKYGALSVTSGQVSIEWSVRSDNGSDRTLTLRWVERGGPPARAPQRAGFGTRLIKTVAAGLDGEADLLFEPSGLHFTASIPLRN